MNFTKHLLPNSISFGTLPLGEDYIAALFGITKKHNEVVILKDPRVSVANKYMLKQYRRLEKAARADDYKRFEALADCLLRKSKVYQYIGMHRVQSGWFWELKAWKIRSIMRKLSKISEIRSGKVDFERIWIPKGSDPYGRPLGVPKVEWRIWSWMNLNIMEIWDECRGNKPTWQHGGMSRKGVITAWKELIPKLDSPNIMEFDIKGFFNNISHQYIEKYLDTQGLFSFRDWVIQTLQSKPSRDNQPPIEEERPFFKLQAVITEIIGENENYDPAIEYTKGCEDIKSFEEWGLNDLKQYKYGQELHDLIMESQIADLDVGAKRNKYYQLDQDGKGVPQGLGTSPYLAVMALKEALEDIPGLLMYMDDGIITADTQTELLDRFEMLIDRLELAGLKIAPQKTFRNKVNGIWERDLKFLGLRYQPDMDWICSDTRGGKVEQFPRAQALDTLNQMWFNKPGGSNNTLISLMGRSAHHVAREFGLLGLFTAKVWAPDLGTSERELIEIGINKAYNGMRSQTKTFMFDNREAWNFIEEDRSKLVTTASTRMIRLVLEQGFQKPTLARRRK